MVGLCSSGFLSRWAMSRPLHQLDAAMNFTAGGCLPGLCCVELSELPL